MEKQELQERIEDGNLANSIFWVVTFPTRYSTSQDILFSTDLEGLMLQFKGGLRADDIVGFFLDADKAEEMAASVLHPTESVTNVTGMFRSLRD